MSLIRKPTLVATLMILATAAGAVAARCACPAQAGDPSNPPATQTGSAKKTDRPETDTVRRIKPGDLLHIVVLDTLPNQPIHGVFQVEDSGKVALGPLYGRANIKGLTVEGAEPVIEEILAKIIKSPRVQVTWAIPTAGGAQQREMALERRVECLEKELRALQAVVNELRKKP